MFLLHQKLINEEWQLDHPFSQLTQSMKALNVDKNFGAVSGHDLIKISTAHSSRIVAWSHASIANNHTSENTALVSPAVLGTLSIEFI